MAQVDDTVYREDSSTIQSCDSAGQAERFIVQTPFTGSDAQDHEDNMPRSNTEGDFQKAEHSSAHITDGEAQDDTARTYTEEELREANRMPTREENIKSAQLIWSEYLSQTDQIDAALVENWKGDADSILIFTGLFSATVGAFLVESYKGLKSDSGDTTAELLSQLLAFTIDGTRPSASPPTPFHASQSSVWLNVLWFCSLVLSLTCALGATLVRQWVRSYTQATQDLKSSALERGRARALVFNGVTRFYMPEIIRGMPILLHCALLLFFVGLVVFLRPINDAVANVVLAIISVVGAVYAFFTLLPVVMADSPYRTPFSSILWRSLLPPFLLICEVMRRLCDWHSAFYFRARMLMGRFKQSMDAYHADRRHWERFTGPADLDALTDIIAARGESWEEKYPLVVDSASAFLSAIPGTKEGLECYFVNLRPSIIPEMTFPAYLFGGDHETAFMRLLWVLSTSRHSNTSGLAQTSPLGTILAQIALHPPSFITRYIPSEDLISSPSRIIAVTAVCLRAWTRYYDLLEDSNAFLNLYSDTVDLLYDLLPYYDEDSRIRKVLDPIIRAYANRLENIAPPVTPRPYFPLPLRRRLMAMWSEIEVLSHRSDYYLEPKRRTIFTPPSYMKAPTKFIHPPEEGYSLRWQGALGVHYRELLASLRPFYDHLPPPSPDGSGAFAESQGQLYTPLAMETELDTGIGHVEDAETSPTWTHGGNSTHRCMTHTYPVPSERFACAGATWCFSRCVSLHRDDSIRP